MNRLGIFIWLGLSSFTWGADIPAPVRKALTQRCARCHNPEVSKGELDLSSGMSLQRGSESGPVIVPGEPDASRLLEVLTTGEMPPEGEGPGLNAAEISALRDWIGQLGPPEPATTSLNQHDVLPTLLSKCAECHGRQLREGELDVRSLDSLLMGGKSGPAIVRGDPQASLLWQKIQSQEMPPRDKLAKYSVKPVSEQELATLTQWIEQGAPFAEVTPDAPSAQGDPLVSDADRQHWAFQAPQLPPVPHVPGELAAEAYGPVDRFLLAKLAPAGLPFAPRADRLTLLRRLSFDLLGLPPSPQQVQAFLTDDSPEAYTRLVDSLLASPHYGERWGQFWLDLAGYADSEGVQHADPVRPHAYRYRDYVIQAFNQGKRYDRFLLEQIAGDELRDYEHAEEIDQELYDNLVATGFLRMSADGTFAGITGFLPNRMDVIDDQLRILSSSVMGITIRCARCHSHKFDPIPQRDYYRLSAVFKGALDEFDWLRPLPGSAGKPRYLPHVTSVERRAWEAHEARIETALTPLKKQLAQVKSSESKDPEQQKQLEASIADWEAQRMPEPQIRALWDNGQPSPTYVRVRGEATRMGRVVGPGVPSALTDGRTPFIASATWPGAQKTGNRRALAEWLIRDDHPLTARVLVNRVWKHHFGRGLVEPLDDFGRAGGTPTHPELLDWLAVHFVRHHYQVKWLHRELLLSRAYQQTSRVDDVRQARDPENLWLSRMPLRRMDAEELRDSVLQLADKLNRRAFGPADAVEARKDGLVTATPTAGAWRRSIYVQKRRTQRLTVLDNFDRPRMSPNCVDRSISNVAPQALHLMNNRLIRELSDQLAVRVRREAGNDPGAQIRRLHLLALGRPPNQAEQEAMRATLRHIRHLQADSSDKEDALATLCHATLNSAAFLYID